MPKNQSRMATKLQETKCKIHSVKLTSYCNDCDDFVCNMCKQPKSGQHDGHVLMSATEKTNELKEEVGDYMNMINENVFNHVQQNIREAYSIQSGLERNCEELINEGNRREKHLMKEIQKSSRKLKDDIEAHRLKYSPGLASKLGNLEDNKKRIESLLKRCENSINTGNSYEILELIKTKSSALNFNTTFSSLTTVPKMELHPLRPVYLVGDIFGSIRQSRVVSSEGIRVLKSWRYDIYIENIFARHDCIWVNKTGFFVSVKPLTVQEVDRKLCPVYPGSFIVTASSEIIYSVSHEHSIYKITPVLTVKLKHTYPYVPSGLCLALQGGFYATMYRAGAHGKVVRYVNDECSDWSEIVCYKNGESVLKKPVKIVENANRDLWVIDASPGSVIGFNSVGRLKCEYKGKRDNFEPIGICIDCRCNILISDYGNKLIDVLLHDGQLLTSIKLQPFGISRPMGICVTKDGHLCVGQGNGYVHVLRYLQ